VQRGPRDGTRWGGALVGGRGGRAGPEEWSPLGWVEVKGGGGVHAVAAAAAAAAAGAGAGARAAAGPVGGGVEVAREEEDWEGPAKKPFGHLGRGGGRGQRGLPAAVAGGGAGDP